MKLTVSAMTAVGAQYLSARGSCSFSIFLIIDIVLRLAVLWEYEVKLYVFFIYFESKGIAGFCLGG